LNDVLILPFKDTAKLVYFLPSSIKVSFNTFEKENENFAKFVRT